MKHCLRIAYVGTDFAGWQRQKNALAVQQVVEEALARILGRSVTVVGAGRTDAGVHARGQAAHVAVAARSPAAATRRALVHGANRHLPPSVRVLDAARVNDAFHARTSAVLKVYGYRLCRARVIDPFRAPFVAPAPRELDVEAMKSAASLLPGRHDFSAFARSGGSHRQPERTIHRAEWIEAGDELIFRVAGDGFLRGMVRALVGTTLEIGRGRRSVDDFADLLGGGSRTEAGPNAPARGLCLERVEYSRRQ